MAKCRECGREADEQHFAEEGLCKVCHDARSNKPARGSLADLTQRVEALEAQAKTGAFKFPGGGTT